MSSVGYWRQGADQRDVLSQVGVLVQHDVVAGHALAVTQYLQSSSDHERRPNTSLYSLRLVGQVEDVVDGCGQILGAHLPPSEVPELSVHLARVQGLQSSNLNLTNHHIYTDGMVTRVSVASEVDHPDVVVPVGQEEGQTVLPTLHHDVGRGGLVAVEVQHYFPCRVHLRYSEQVSAQV